MNEKRLTSLYDIDYRTANRPMHEEPLQDCTRSAVQSPMKTRQSSPISVFLNHIWRAMHMSVHVSYLNLCMCSENHCHTRFCHAPQSNRGWILNRRHKLFFLDETRVPASWITKAIFLSLVLRSSCFLPPACFDFFSCFSFFHTCCHSSFSHQAQGKDYNNTCGEKPRNRVVRWYLLYWN